MKQFLSILVATDLLLRLPLSAGTTGEEVFLKNCASCHGKEGKGNTPAGKKLGAKDLTISRTTSAEVEKQISQGMREKNGTIKMPAFEGKLSPDETREVIAYVLKLRR